MDQENKENKKEEAVKVKEIHHHHYRRPGSFFGRLAWGLIIIFIGVLFLGQNFGIIPQVEIWSFFATFWPVFIIFAGLSIMARGGWFLGIISVIILLAIFGLFFVWFAGAPILGTSYPFMPYMNLDINGQEIPGCVFWNRY